MVSRGEGLVFGFILIGAIICTRALRRGRALKLAGHSVVYRIGWLLRTRRLLVCELLLRRIYGLLRIGGLLIGLLRLRLVSGLLLLRSWHAKLGAVLSDHPVILGKIPLHIGQDIIGIFSGAVIDGVGVGLRLSGYLRRTRTCLFVYLGIADAGLILDLRLMVEVLGACLRLREHIVRLFVCLREDLLGLLLGVVDAVIRLCQNARSAANVFRNGHFQVAQQVVQALDFDNTPALAAELCAGAFFKLLFDA